MDKHIRDGRGALRPYLYCKSDMIEFVQNVFGATVTGRFDTPIGAHVEAIVGDTPFVMETADEFPPNIKPTIASVYLYVTDVDDVFAKAIASGARALAEPEDKPYDERQGGIVDSFGNTWWIATHNNARV